MRIEIKRVWAKNFRSIDNMGLELNFEKEGAVMIGSLDNGAGKSTLSVWALYYNWFDKPYGAGTTKTGLINSRSNKDLLTESEFRVNGHDWKVVRGQKPTVFQIFKDGVEIKDEASLKHFQAHLEEIIGMDEKVFCNTIAIGPDKFVPFVSMSAGDRRNYGEQMLDLMVISKMNEMHKADKKALENNMQTLNGNATGLELQIANKKSVIELKKKHASEIQSGIDQEIDEAKSRASAQDSSIASVQGSIDEFATRQKEVGAERDTLSGFLKMKEDILEKAKKLAGEIQTAKAGGACPCCGQSLPQDKIDEHVSKLSARAEELKRGIALANAKIAEMRPLGDIEAEFASYSKRFSELQSELNYMNAAKNAALSDVRRLEAKKAQSSNVQSWDEDEVALKNLETELAEVKSKMNDLAISIRSADIISAALKDDGYKAKVVDQFLPFINEKVNEYLAAMNFFVHVELNNEFEVNMIAPDRRGQTIAGLSTGQKRRIDLAILFAWRAVAKAASGCDSNLLIMDEALENLSEQGVTDFLEMWHRMNASGECNLYVITQRCKEFEPMFENKIIYALRDDATYVVEED